MRKVSLLLSTAIVTGSMYSASAFAMALFPKTTSAPEIDGPAGVAAIALLTAGGILAYRRMRGQ